MPRMTRMVRITRTPEALEKTSGFRVIGIIRVIRVIRCSAVRGPGGKVQIEKKGRPIRPPFFVHSMASGHRSPTRHETVDDHDERDHQEKVDYSTNVYHEGTEEPKDEQDDGDRPEHACPLSENCLPSAAMTRRAAGMPHPGSSAPE